MVDTTCVKRVSGLKCGDMVAFAIVAAFSTIQKLLFIAKPWARCRIVLGVRCFLDPDLLNFSLLECESFSVSSMVIFCFRRLFSASAACRAYTPTSMDRVRGCYWD